MSLAPGICLVTGATWFVGSAVARALLLKGNQVRVLARPGGDRRNLGGLSVEISEGAMEDAPSLARAVAGCCYLFHVAADYRLWVPDPAAMFRANVDGTRELMQAALTAGVEGIVYRRRRRRNADRIPARLASTPTGNSTTARWCCQPAPPSCASQK